MRPLYTIILLMACFSMARAQTHEPTIDELITRLGIGPYGDDAWVSHEFALIGDSAVPALADKNANVRRDACEALGEIGDRRAVESLIARLTDSSPEVRAGAAWALGAIRDRRAVPALIHALGDRGGYVGLRAVDALGWIGDPRASTALMKLVRPKGSLANEAARALGSIRESRAVPLLVSVLGIDHCHCYGSEGIGAIALGDNAAEALGRIGKPASEALIKALNSNDEYVRERAATALTPIRESRASVPLLRLLHDK